MDSLPPDDLLKYQAEQLAKAAKEEQEFKEARERSASPHMKTPTSMRGAFFTQQTQTEWSWLKDMEVR